MQPAELTGILIKAVSGESEYGLRTFPPAATTLVVGSVLAVWDFAAGVLGFAADGAPELVVEVVVELWVVVGLAVGAALADAFCARAACTCSPRRAANILKLATHFR